ncbi:unnamed protein product [Phytomonas sp. EM1]|nr:unnamed protein product [Phytomonas sp. EM1]|eukprot:CCW62345.1 unnamed protein product [Phytomonas sp. isolate EM1]
MSTDMLPFLLVASDLDGTLFDNNCQISDYSKRVIFRLYHEKNVKLVMATGRHWRCVEAAKNSLVEYFKRAYAELESTKEGETIPEKHHGFYVISSNGALAHDDEGRVLVERHINPDIVKELYCSYGLPNTGLKRKQKQTDNEKECGLPSSPDSSSGNGENKFGEPQANATNVDVGGLNEDPDEFSLEKVRVSAYTAKEWFLTSRFLPEEMMMKKFGYIPIIMEFDPKDPRNDGKSVHDLLPSEGVNKICFRSKDRALLSTIEQELHERFGDQISVAFSSNFCLDVGPSGVTKFSALHEIANHLHIDVKRILSFGDSMNDKEMLENVAKGFLMDNAQLRLKKLLPQCTVIGHNNDDSVAKKIEEVFNLV